MLADLIFMLVISLFVLHAYTTTQNQFAATASAIRQIWSGGCPLSCRQSQYSRFSGFSNQPSSQTGPCRTMPAQSGQPGHSQECACESCPCALIENFLSNCRPATNMYTQLIDCSLNCVYYCIQLIIDAYNYLMRVLECQATCQQIEAPATNSNNQKRQIDAKDNFSFGKDEKAKMSDKLKRLADKTNKDKNLNLDKIDSPLYRDTKNTSNEQIAKPPSVTDSKTKTGTSKESDSKLTNGHSPLCKIISDSLLKLKGSKENLNEEQKGYCSKCVEKGRICIKECPKAKQK